jgi:HEAT repeat protein
VVFDGDDDKTVAQFCRFALREIDPEREFARPLSVSAKDVEPESPVVALEPSNVSKRGLPSRFQRDLPGEFPEKWELPSKARSALLQGDPAAVPRLCELLTSTSPHLRQAAIYGLYRVGKQNPDAVAALYSVAYDGDFDPTMVRFARSVLRKVDPELAACADNR